MSHVLVTNVDASTLFISRNLAALTLGISLPSLDKMLLRNELEWVKVGSRILIRRESLESLGRTTRQPVK